MYIVKANAISRKRNAFVTIIEFAQGIKVMDMYGNNVYKIAQIPIVMESYWLIWG